MTMFHQGNRDLQEHFGSTALADRLVECLRRSEFTDDDKVFIHSVEFFFLATAAPDGHPDCSFKGGPPGFVRIVRPDLLVWPDYDGNGMFKSLGNIRANPAVGLLFLSFEEPKRLRVNGTATVSAQDLTMSLFPGARLLVRVTPHHIFPNCPRYIPKMQMLEASPYVPRAGCETPIPNWKKRPHFREVLPAGDPARNEGGDA